MTADDQRVTTASVWSVTASSRSTWVMVSVAAGGLRGVGELSDGGPLADLVEAARAAAALVEGLDVDVARRAITTELERRRRDAANPALAFLWSTVLGGYASAIADLEARLSGRSLSAFLGLGEPIPVRAYANLNRRWGGTDEVVGEATKAAASGLMAVKVAPFTALAAGGTLDRAHLLQGLERVRSTREALPAGTLLMVDCHHRVPADLFAVIAKGLAPLNPYWVEDLVDVTDPSALRAAATTVNLPLAGGEHVWDPRVAATASATGALDFWLLDPKHAGGPVGAARIAGAVSSAMVTFHNPSGPVGTAHAVHLAGIAAEQTWLELPWGEHDGAAFRGAAELVEGGRLRAAPGPGAGCLPIDETFADGIPTDSGAQSASPRRSDAPDTRDRLAGNRS